MSPLQSSASSWSRLFHEFRCPGCGNPDAYRSRPKGLFEKIILPVLMLKPVRCERCYHRSYAFRTVPVQERISPDKSSPANPSTSGTGARVA